MMCRKISQASEPGAVCQSPWRPLTSKSYITFDKFKTNVHETSMINTRNLLLEQEVYDDCRLSCLVTE